MKKNPRNSAVLALLLIYSAALSAADAASCADAITNGEAKVDIRYRFENVDQQDLLKDANASTIRTRLGYQTGTFNGFKVYFEVDDVRKLGVADYTTPGAGALATQIGPKTVGRPVIADPLDTDLNQLLLAYSNDKTDLVFGRQRIIRGNARFIGNVGWRQHEQTYDAISFENKSIKDLTLFAAYINRRNTVTFTDIDQDTVLIDAHYAGLENIKLAAYFYDIQVDNTNMKWENMGVRLDGKAKQFTYVLEYAKQDTGSAANPDYALLEASFKFEQAALTAGVEILGSDANTGFATPLATLHKFNGWADQFLSTPPVGLEDKYLQLSRNYKDLGFTLVVHQFDADKGSIDFGREFDLMASKKLSDNYSIGAKYADYSAGDVAGGKVDTRKLWLWAQAKF